MTTDFEITKLWQLMRIYEHDKSDVALPTLRYYRELCVADGCTPYQFDVLDEMIRRFEGFTTSPTMKQPGITKGR